MKLYEIKDFDKGVKVCWWQWPGDWYVFKTQVSGIQDWLDQDGKLANDTVARYFTSDCWEVYGKESTQPKRKTTSFYRYTYVKYKDGTTNGVLCQTNWSTADFPNDSETVIVKIETKEVEL